MIEPIKETVEIVWHHVSEKPPRNGWYLVYCPNSLSKEGKWGRSWHSWSGWGRATVEWWAYPIIPTNLESYVNMGAGI